MNQDIETKPTFAERCVSDIADINQQLQNPESLTADQYFSLVDEQITYREQLAQIEKRNHLATDTDHSRIGRFARLLGRN